MLWCYHAEMFTYNQQQYVYEYYKLSSFMTIPKPTDV